MTTVAANRHSVAADSRACDSAGMITRVRKIHRVNDEILAYAGDMSDGLLFLKWAKSGFDPEQAPDLDHGEPDGYGVEALVLNSHGLWYYGTRLVAAEVSEPFYAIGTGAQLAVGAMAAGATPEEAVKIACEWEPNTGPPVSVESLEG